MKHLQFTPTAAYYLFCYLFVVRYQLNIRILYRYQTTVNLCILTMFNSISYVYKKQFKILYIEPLFQHNDLIAPFHNTVTNWASINVWEASCIFSIGHFHWNVIHLSIAKKSKRNQTLIFY